MCQEICFVPDQDYASFIQNETGIVAPKGNFVNTKGEILGTHEGITHYTVGQRRGLGLPMGHRVFVLEIRPETNEVVVGENEEVFAKVVKANKVNYKPGEFSKYADRYLRLTNVSAEPEEYWELNSVKVKPVGVPNSEATYFVKLKDKTVAPLMELTEEGLIKSINVPYSSNNAKNAANNAVAPQRKANPRDFLTEEILMASSTAKMAELVAKEIYNIRESKNALLRGQADNMPSDGAQLKIMLDNLNLQEEAMTEMFSGVRNKEEKTFTVRLTPDKEFDNEVAFRFSKKLGIVANNDLAGTPFYISLKDLKSVKIPQEDDKKKKDLDGIAYNVPGQAMVTLTDGKKKLYEGELPITQFGVIEYLAPVLFNKNSTIKVYFDPNTGGLLKVDREEGK